MIARSGKETKIANLLVSLFIDLHLLLDKNLNNVKYFKNHESITIFYKEFE
jgi:hypothetical protein